MKTLKSLSRPARTQMWSLLPSRQRMPAWSYTVFWSNSTIACCTLTRTPLSVSKDGEWEPPTGSYLGELTSTRVLICSLHHLSFYSFNSATNLLIYCFYSFALLLICAYTHLTHVLFYSFPHFLVCPFTLLLIFSFAHSTHLLFYCCAHFTHGVGSISFIGIGNCTRNGFARVLSWH